MKAAQIDASPRPQPSCAFAAEDPLALLYAAREETRNHAVVLREWLLRQQ